MASIGKLQPKQPASAPPASVTAAASKIDALTKFVEQIANQLSQTTTGQACLAKRACQNVSCKLWHPEGRIIEDNPKNLICYQGRKCPQRVCKWFHLAGRGLDENASNPCPAGAQCDSLACKLGHPDNRTLVTPYQCFTCGKAGHTRRECMLGFDFIRIGDFPEYEHWAGQGDDALLKHLFAELEAFGKLMMQPTILSDDKVYARFADVEMTKLAVDMLSKQGFEINMCIQPRIPAKFKGLDCTVFVGNLPYDVNESELRSVLNRVGRVSSLRLAHNRDTSESKGFAFCDYSSKEVAALAVSKLDGEMVGNRRIRLSASGEPPKTGDNGVTIKGLPSSWSESQLQEFLKSSTSEVSFRGVMVSQLLKGITMISSDGDEGGSATVDFVNRGAMMAAWRCLKEQKICGKPLTVVLPEGLEARPLNRTSRGSFKTDMCRYFAKGECLYGQQCTNAHSPEELRNSSNNDKLCTIHIGNVPLSASQEELEALCSKYGAVESVRMVYDQDTQRFKGFAFCQYAAEYDADLACDELDEFEFKGRPLKVRRASAALGTVPDTQVSITGFPKGWAASDVESFLKEGASSRISCIVSLSEPGSAKVTFQSTEQAKEICSDFDGKTVGSTRLSVTIEGSRGKKLKPKDDLDDAGRDRKHGYFIIHLDELAMPKRPSVQACEEDREVFVDSLPLEEDEQEWTSIFGEAEDVYRLVDEATGKPGNKGYVRFKDHESALRCVDAGSGEWSESERAITSQASSREKGRPCTYPLSVISLLLGRGGEAITKMKEEIGARALNLRGRGLTAGDNVGSERTHFACKGPPDAIAKLRPALEDRLAYIHREITSTIETGQRKRSRSPRRQKKAASPQRQSEPAAPWQPPGGDVGHSFPPPPPPHSHWAHPPPPPMGPPGMHPPPPPPPHYAPPFDAFWPPPPPGYGSPSPYAYPTSGAPSGADSSLRPPGSWQTTPRPTPSSRTSHDEEGGERHRRRRRHRRRDGSRSRSPA
eukprot:TRINITY_DN27141_c0_g1_i2.p1 TRINITY_DN27141_c0_g1~~TRINITY_DN27141_c0_g1_i2.p1  ORF type:complete len:992 (-),score=149.90 TRINITY_DN27141_c0_g1_i2:22-2997(-)